MSSMIVRRGVVVGLGAAAGALAAAALLNTAPIASADDTDFVLPLPAPAVTDLYTYSDETIIGEGSQTVTYDTVYTGSGTPTTTTTTDVLPTGTTEYGYENIDTSTLTLGADSWTTESQSALFDTFSATGNTFLDIPPLFEIASTP
jgi:hypothetical protein